jgi:hypothetical protein
MSPMIAFPIRSAYHPGMRYERKKDKIGTMKNEPRKVLAERNAILLSRDCDI